MAFGAYAPLGANQSTPLEVTGSLKVHCTAGGAAFTLTADNGLYSADATATCATGTCTRAMISGTSYVSYDLYTTNAYATVWNAANALSGTSTGGQDTVDFYGYVPAGIAQTAGTYADTVTVTVTF